LTDKNEDHFKSELDEILNQIEKLALNKKDEDKLADLKEKERKTRLKLSELRASSEENWGELKIDLEKNYDELNKAISSFH
jgi:hypothetical protein